MSQQDFRAALLDSDKAVPEGLLDPADRPAGKRFAVYRNNVAVGLTEALSKTFPVVRQIVGTEFFDAMAGVFLRRHPPRSAVLSNYGGAMPEFLRSFPPAAHLGYLPDVARLELAICRAYHAADAAPFDAMELAAIPADRLLAVRFQLAPAVALIRSAWPIHAIWQANQLKDAPKPVMCAEDVLVTRPEFDPQPVLLPEGSGAVMQRLMQGASLGDATDDDEAVLSALFQLLLRCGAITGFSEGDR